MGGFLTSLLWIIFSCTDTSLENGVFSFQGGDVFFEMRVRDELFNSAVCVSFLSTVSMTADGECVEAVVQQTTDDITHVRFLTNAGVGEVEYTIRIQNGVIRIPTVGVEGFVEGVLEAKAIDESIFASRRVSVAQRLEQERQYWQEGAFSLQTLTGDVKGALVFDGEGVRVFVFDRHWLTPEIQYASLETDGFDWIVEFDTEPQFLDSSTYIRIHFLERVVSIPQSLKRSDTDIQYQMVPNPPSFDVLKQLQLKQIDRSVDEERQTLIEAVQQLAKNLTTDEACLDWMDSGALQTPFWMGYSVRTSWVDFQCVLYIEPETVQYRRTFIGTIYPKSN